MVFVSLTNQTLLWSTSLALFHIQILHSTTPTGVLRMFPSQSYHNLPYTLTPTTPGRCMDTSHTDMVVRSPGVYSVNQEQVGAPARPKSNQLMKPPVLLNIFATSSTTSKGMTQTLQPLYPMTMTIKDV
jgi:hypothetical protein